jgi:hypothetical protein
LAAGCLGLGRALDLDGVRGWLRGLRDRQRSARARGPGPAEASGFAREAAAWSGLGALPRRVPAAEEGRSGCAGSGWEAGRGRSARVRRGGWLPLRNREPAVLRARNARFAPEAGCTAAARSVERGAGRAGDPTGAVEGVRWAQSSRAPGAMGERVAPIERGSGRRRRPALRQSVGVRNGRDGLARSGRAAPVRADRGSSGLRDSSEAAGGRGPRLRRGLEGRGVVGRLGDEVRAHGRGREGSTRRRRRGGVGSIAARRRRRGGSRCGPPRSRRMRPGWLVRG